MKQMTIKKKITLWYTGIIAVVLGTILVLVLLFVDRVGISATEEEISAAVTGFSSNINFRMIPFILTWILNFTITVLCFVFMTKMDDYFMERFQPNFQKKLSSCRIHRER